MMEQFKMSKCPMTECDGTGNTSTDLLSQIRRNEESHQYNRNEICELRTENRRA